MSMHYSAAGHLIVPRDVDPEFATSLFKAADHWFIQEMDVEFELDEDHVRIVFHNYGETSNGATTYVNQHIANIAEALGALSGSVEHKCDADDDLPWTTYFGKFALEAELEDVQYQIKDLQHRENQLLIWIQHRDQTT